MDVKAGWIGKNEDPYCVIITDDNDRTIKIPINNIKRLCIELQASLVDFIASDSFDLIFVDVEDRNLKSST